MQSTVRFEPGPGAGDFVAVKSYRPEAAGFDAEVAGLQVLDDIAATVPATAGWSAGSARLLSFDERARQLTTVAVDGVPIDRAELTAPDAAAACEVVCGLLEAFWEASSTIFGDLTLDNVLVDVGRRRVVLIDPGAPRDVWHCAGVPDRHAPASRDIGYLLYSACTGLRGVERSRRRRRREIAWRLALRLAEPHDRGLPAEAMACAAVHLERLRSFRSRRWRRRLVHLATRRRLRGSAPPGWSLPNR